MCPTPTPIPPQGFTKTVKLLTRTQRVASVEALMASPAAAAALIKNHIVKRALDTRAMRKGNTFASGTGQDLMVLEG